MVLLFFCTKENDRHKFLTVYTRTRTRAGVSKPKGNSPVFYQTDGFFIAKRSKRHIGISIFLHERTQEQSQIFDRFRSYVTFRMEESLFRSSC